VNAGREFDRALREPFLAHGYNHIMPLSTGFYVTFNAISSAGTILIGVLIGELLRGRLASGKKALVLLLAAGGLLAAGYFSREWVPHVKRLWTASFALYAAGWTCAMMLFFYVVIDIIGFRWWAFPFVVVGVNSIFIYVSSGILNGTIKNVLKPFTDQPLQHLGPWAPVALAGLVLFVQWLLCLFLYCKRIYFKV
jgi:predicted acyltransferase